MKENNGRIGKFERKVVIVTGASSGIGKAIAIRLARERAKVALIARDIEKLESVSAEIRKMGGEVKDFVCDITDFHRVKNCIEEVVKYFGNVDNLVNNAGILNVCPLFYLKEEGIKKVVDTNILGMVYFSKFFSLELKRNKSKGVILNISSIAGVVAQSGLSIYSASKGAVISFTKSLALELAPYGIRVNTIVPGVVETPMTEKLFSMLGDEIKEKIISRHPLGVGKAEDIASAACFLLSDESKWITGTILNVDGGYTA